MFSLLLPCTELHPTMPRQCVRKSGVSRVEPGYDSIATVGEIRVYRRADFQSGSRVLKKVF